MTSDSNIKDNKQPLFKDLKADEDIPDVTEIESLCVQCEKQGTTRLLLTKIPFFKEIVIMAFQCPNCHYKNNSIEPSATIQEKGIRLKLHSRNNLDLNRQIVKQHSASIRIEELNFEAPPFTSQGALTTVEGILSTAIEGLEQQQPVRRIMDPDVAAKIDDVIMKLNEYKDGKNPFNMIIEDVSGNSFIENRFAPDPDQCVTVEHFERTKEQNESLGIYEENKISDEPETNDITDEVMEFPTNCANCQTAIMTKMKMVNIPHFKEVVIMASNCDTCGWKSNEVKSGGAIEPKGHKITLKMTGKTDLTRDVLLSETCTVEIPDLEMDLCHSSLGGKFTTLEGLLVNIKEKLGLINPFSFGDSATVNTKMKDLIQKLDEIIAGNLFVSIVFDDPIGNSFIQNIYAPDMDPELTTELYERTEEQNEMLGLLDMNTENYIEKE